ncbi:MAG: hypothetical protein P4M09_00100 [Devosia sp.]|nr:hypothetical protein [Devosia sp.]
MTARRRLDRLEQSLGPKEAILRWLEEAHRFPSVVEYARATIDVPESSQPSIRIIEQVAAAVHRTRRGRSDDELERAVRRGIGDTVFLFQLVFILNQTAADFAQLAMLRSLVLVGHLDHLVTDPLSEDVAARRADPEGARGIDTAWRTLRASVEELVGDVRVEQAARSDLDQAYFAGRSVLFAEVAQAWTRTGEQVDRLDSIMETLREPFRTRAGFGLRHVLPAKPGLIMARAQSRAAELADNARIAAFEIFGDRGRAIVIAESRLRIS